MRSEVVYELVGLDESARRRLSDALDGATEVDEARVEAQPDETTRLRLALASRAPSPVVEKLVAQLGGRVRSCTTSGTIDAA